MSTAALSLNMEASCVVSVTFPSTVRSFNRMIPVPSAREVTEHRPSQCLWLESHRDLINPSVCHLFEWLGWWPMGCFLYEGTVLVYSARSLCVAS